MSDIRPLAEPDRQAAQALRDHVFQQRPRPYDEEIDRHWYAPLHRRLGAFSDARLVGHLAVWDMGQWFGGRRVPMGGVAGVAVAPEHRGGGLATELLSRAVRLMHEQGDAISTLFPANVGLYRSCGWELAGARPTHTTTTTALASLPRPTGYVHVRPAGDADQAAIAAVYGQFAPTEPGMLDRPEHYAGRISGEREGHDVYLAEAGGRVTGYLWCSRSTPASADEGFATDVNEWVALDRDSLLALWRLVGSSRPISRTVRFVDSPYGWLTAALHDPGAGREVLVEPAQEHSMTRLVDVSVAMAARGFPESAQAEVSLQISDELAPWNAGRWLLQVADGAGTLSPGGAGDVRVDIATLSSIYTGWTDAGAAARLGWLTGSEQGVAALASCFASRTPWMLSYF